MTFMQMVHPVTPNQVLVKIEATGINPVEVGLQ
jgi:NADPH:quinone reductase-like Zn-dependent oxidoreductase